MTRRSAAVQVVLGAALGLALLIGGGLAWLRWQGATRAALRARDLPVTVARAGPIVDAIGRYAKRYGAPPRALADLVPHHLPRLPNPGPIARGDWDYRCDAGTDVGGWALRIWVKETYSPNLFMGFGDVFAYHPSGRYPTHAYGGVLVRYGKWGYYVE
jgi:hypothetical protein